FAAHCARKGNAFATLSSASAKSSGLRNSPNTIVSLSSGWSPAPQTQVPAVVPFAAGASDAACGSSVGGLSPSEGGGMSTSAIGLGGGAGGGGGGGSISSKRLSDFSISSSARSGFERSCGSITSTRSSFDQVNVYWCWVAHSFHAACAA